LLVFSIALIASPAAAEKYKWHGTSFATETQTMDVGDEEGHMLLIMKFKQLTINENTGEKFVNTSVNTLDINPKAMIATMHGYGVRIDKDGDQILSSSEGKMVGKDHWVGTYIITKGTGKFEGIKGKGTWDSYNLGPGQPSYMEGEVEFEVPAK
jgi:hypothetical protein